MMECRANFKLKINFTKKVIVFKFFYNRMYHLNKIKTKNKKRKTGCKFKITK